MATKFQLPDLGEGVESATVAEIHVSEGETIEADQIVMELETEKAVADLPCPHEGTIQKIHVSEGDAIQVGDLLLTIEESESEEKTEQSDESEAEKPPKEEVKEEQKKEAAAEEKQGEKKEQKEVAEEPPKEEEEEEKKKKKKKQAAAEEKQGEKKEQKEVAEKPVEEEGESPQKQEQGETKPREGWKPQPAGPATRRLARKLNVDLKHVDGSGRGGRVTQEDVVHAHDSDGKIPSMPEMPDFEKAGEIKRQSLNRIEKPAVENLSRSWRAIPHVTQQGLADITELAEDRREHNPQAGEEGTKISMTALAVKAITAALRDFPRFNASLDPNRQEVILKRYYHIGIAVDTEDGLLVPVLREADSKSILEIAEEIQTLARQARDGKLKPDDMRGATFTISNQGPIAAESSHDDSPIYDSGFTPIIPWPQVAILGLSPARKQMLVVADEPQIRLVLPMSLSYDHRVINGADAARFLRHLANLFSESFNLLIES